MLERKVKLTRQQSQSLEFSSELGPIYLIELDKVIEERCDELDNMIEDQGYEIIHRDYKIIATSIFSYKVYFC